tara:strand:- start:6 stop:671 length:666 start_codon:yes stop_codon:yes gene_type:complete
MSEATHTGRLKYISEILSSVGDEGASKSFIDYILKNENKERELTSFGKCDKRFFDGDMCVIDDYFTDLKPIKPVIEIPPCPFWFTCDEDGDEDVVYSASLLGDGLYKIRWEGDDAGHQDCSRGRVFDNLNKIHKAWTICEEPKEVMRPFTDEEWKEWFLNDGVLLHEQSGCLWKPQTMNKRIMFYFFDLDDQEDKWYDKDYINEKYTDRHGNKFEKELVGC